MRFYDSVYDADDRPDEKIINDNDRIDQWMKNKVNQYEEDRKKRMAKRKGVPVRSAHDHTSVIDF